MRTRVGDHYLFFERGINMNSVDHQFTSPTLSKYSHVKYKGAVHESRSIEDVHRRVTCGIVGDRSALAGEADAMPTGRSILAACVTHSPPSSQDTGADYTLEVRAFTYRNSRNRDSNGDCCDIGFFSCGGCDNQFVFCLRGSSTPNDGNPNNCPLGRYRTGDIGDDSFTFSTPNLASGVPNPMTFSGSVWPVSVLHN